MLHVELIGKAVFYTLLAIACFELGVALPIWGFVSLINFGFRSRERSEELLAAQRCLHCSECLGTAEAKRALYDSPESEKGLRMPLSHVVRCARCGKEHVFSWVRKGLEPFVPK